MPPNRTDGCSITGKRPVILPILHVVVPCDYSKLIWVSILGYLVFGEVPDEFVWTGGTMIFVATAYIAWWERGLRRPVRPAATAEEETP